METRKPNSKNNSIKVTILSILAVLFLASVASGKGFLSILNFAQNNPTQKQAEITEYSNENGYVELKPSGNKKVFTRGNQEAIDVNVSLKDKQITGFTIPVAYSPDKYEMVGAETVDSRYNMYFKKEGDSSIILVGVQQPTNTEKITLYKATVARLVFKTLSGGVSDIDIKDKSPKGYELKLNDEKNDALVPSYGTLQVISK